MQFLRNIKPTAKLMLDALERGEDPYETVVVAGKVNGGSGKVVGRKGQVSCSASAPQHVFLLFMSKGSLGSILISSRNSEMLRL